MTHSHLTAYAPVNAIVRKQPFFLCKVEEGAMSHSGLICEALARVGRPGILEGM
jgi:hypothetical protein